MSILKYLLFVFVTLSTIDTGIAQVQISKRKATSQFLVSMANGISLNKSNVRNNGINPDPIEVSAISYKPSLNFEYQRITSFGLIYGIGVQVGYYSQNFDVQYKSFDFLDTMQELKNTSYSFRFRNHSIYGGLHFFIGYSFLLQQINSASSYLDIKVGITKRFYFSGGSSERYLNGSVLTNDTIFVGYVASYIDDSWGKARNNYPNFLDGYIGLRKHVKGSFISDLNIGVFGTYAMLPFNTSDVDVRNGHYLHGIFKSYDTDHYVNRELTFGVKIGVGLDL